MQGPDPNMTEASQRAGQGNTMSAPLNHDSVTAMEHHAAAVEAPPAEALRPVVSEDWLAVWISAALLIVILVGVRPAVAQFGWTTAADLATVFAVGNIVRWLELG